jgi:hypothetical protein
VDEQIGEQGRDRRALRRAAIPLDQAAVLPLQRRFQPPLPIEQDPALISVVGDGLQDEIPPDGVEELPDLEIEQSR